MHHRLVHLRVPAEHCERVREVIREVDSAAYEQGAGEGSAVFHLVLDADEVEPFLDAVSEIVHDEQAMRAVVVSVAALTPHPLDEEEGRAASEEADSTGAADRVSRQELHQTLTAGAQVTPSFVLMSLLSVTVAAVGLSRDSAAVVIGAMVIAPLLGPNMALALATILADGKLAVRALIANAVGLALTAAVACVAGLIWTLDLGATEVMARTSVTIGEVVLALASGAAGALAMTSAAATSLVGVMVAVSLLPPLVIASMLLVQGHTDAALRAGLLVVGNVVCLNLAAVTVFRLRGIRPRTWYEDERARRATRIAVVVWALLLATVIAFIMFAGVPAKLR